MAVCRCVGVSVCRCGVGSWDDNNWALWYRLQPAGSAVPKERCHHCRAPQCKSGCKGGHCRGDERELEGGVVCRHFCSKYGFCGVGVSYDHLNCETCQA